MKRKTKIILILIAAFILDYACYKIWGFGIINGNILTLDIDINIEILSK